jgi:cytochrome c-type biogenesis protein CcmH/NrfG
LSETNSLLKSMFRQPVSFAILILSVVILIVWLDYKSNLKQAQSNTIAQSAPVAPPFNGDKPASQPIQLSQPGSQSSIMNQFDSGSGKTAAPAIDSLVGGLEAKVKADPGNLNNRILLAQTYRELGRIDDATKELRGILKQDPNNARGNLVLASILSQSADAKELEESLRLLAKIPSDASIQRYMIDLYRGDALNHENNPDGALKNWKQALAAMPESDARYAGLEQKIMSLSKSKPSKAPSGS